MLLKSKVPFSIEGKDYRAGEHEIPDHLAGHWFLAALERSGSLSILSAPQATEPGEQPADAPPAPSLAGPADGAESPIEKEVTEETPEQDEEAKAPEAKHEHKPHGKHHKKGKH